MGVGDDAAVLQPPSGMDMVISTDRVPTDLLALQFGLMGMRDLGSYLAEVNISDIIAMAARPAGLLLNVGLPSDFLISDFREVLEGFIEAGSSHGAPLVGGDTTYAPSPTFSATAVGWVAHDSALRRGGAKLGDRVAVSGNVGAFGAALVYFSARRTGRVNSLSSRTEQRLLEALVKPKARSELVDGLLGEPCVSGAMDITDGLGQTLSEFADASGMGIDVVESHIPIDDTVAEVSEITGTPLMDIAFGIGLDLELLLTLSPAAGLPEEAGGLTLIGEVVESHHGVRVLRGDGRPSPLPGRGWQHFQGDPEDLIAGA
jgi:thiamine-monophosphate kinase